MFNYDFRLKKINNNLNFTAKNSKNTNSSYINKNGECDSVSFNQKPNGKNIFRNAFAIVSTAIITLFPTASKVNADNQQRYAQPQLEPNGIYYDTAEENGYFDEIPVVAKNTPSDVHTTTIIVEERPIENSVVKYAPLDYFASTVVVEETPFENSVVKYAPLDVYTSTVVIEEYPVENSVVKYAPLDVEPFNDETTVTVTSTINMNEYPTVE